MSEQKVDVSEIVQKQYLDDIFSCEDDIIDVSAFDFSDTDRWLCVPTQCSSESVVNDLYAWLRTQQEVDSQCTDINNRKSVDTRTFTRPKKRSTRINFESVIEAIPPLGTNIYKTKTNAFSCVDNTTNKNETVGIEKKTSIPSMLKSTLAPINNLISDESLKLSGQESMEAFLNMSQSKGIDSFINLAEPEFGDTLMNVSEPSIFSSSIVLLGKDDTLSNLDYASTAAAEDSSYSAIRKLTLDKIMDSKHHNNSILSLSEKDNTIIVENKNENKDSVNEKFYNISKDSTEMYLDRTYDTDVKFNSSILPLNLKVEENTESSSSTVKNIYDGDITAVLSQNKESVDKNPCDITYQCVEAEIEKDLAIVNTETNVHNQKNSTNINFNMYKNKIESSNPLSLPMCENGLNSIFNVHTVQLNQSTSKYENLLNSTFKTINKNTNQCPSTYEKTKSLTFKPAPSLRRELLTEIKRSRNHRMDSACNSMSDEHYIEKETKENFDVTCESSVIQKNDIPFENRNNTYTKDSAKDQSKSKNEPINDNIVGCIQKDLHDRKFYTYTKKTNNNGNKTNTENADYYKNMNETFSKPVPKIQKKNVHNAPKMISKLPQFLQKSNPNLVSNPSKTTNISRFTGIPNAGFKKNTRLNMIQNVERLMINKSYSLEKLKSESEQQLLQNDVHALEFQDGAKGSTESIESTHSAHSAPDLDDRLSIYSDSSHNSCNAHTTNIELLHQIARIQEESLKRESTGKLNKQVSENTFTLSYESNLDSPIYMDETVKTSSPIIKPTRSSQSINDVGNLIENRQQDNNGVIKKIGILNKTVNKTEIKTRLRQPTNWNTGSKSNVPSGIPRPASRIPAPRFVRPNTKTTQGDLKRGCL